MNIEWHEFDKIIVRDVNKERYQKQTTRFQMYLDKYNPSSSNNKGLHGIQLEMFYK